MDPNANLREQEEILDGGGPEPFYACLERLEELRRALQEWIRAGGFEPTWSDYPIASEAYELGGYSVKRGT